MLHLLRSLTPNQRGAVIASYLGWTLDAFDFFILVFVLKDVAQEFHTGVETDRKSTRLNSSHIQKSRMPSSA